MSATDEAAVVGCCWTLVAYARSTWAARYSRLHFIAEDETRTLCGISPPIHTPNGHNYEGVCRRCLASPRHPDAVASREAPEEGR